MSEEVRLSVELLRASGVYLDDALMVRPDFLNIPVIRAKVAPDYRRVREGLDALRAGGRPVLYMPGSYDLVHAGHAWHIHAAQELFGPAHVVALADDDDLIHAAKGDGRPVQSCVTGSTVGMPDWRLYDLASLPGVGLTGYLPSPLLATDLAAPEILDAQCGPERLVSILANPPAELAVVGYDEALHAVAGEYASLLALMRYDPRLATAAFVERRYPWSIQAWQLYLHGYLAGGDGAPIVRVMSHRDDAHAVQVAYLMHAAGIRIQYLHEPEIVTTTRLIAEHRREYLLGRKLAPYV